MPSPVAHAAVGYLLYRAFRSRMPQEASRDRGRLLPRLLVATVGLSLVPDLDSVPGILLGNFGRFHNDFANSLIFGLAIALIIGAVVWLRQRSGFKSWVTVALISYELHVLMDFFTVGRGVMLAWPFLVDRFEPPVKLFYGLHWSEGLMSPMHLWTLVTELAFVTAMLFVVYISRARISAGARFSLGSIWRRARAGQN